MRLLPLICAYVLLSGCQSLAVREPVIRPPEVLRQAEFKIPDRARRVLGSNMEYSVVLHILIDKYGNISSISIAKSSGNISLDRQAKRDAMSMQFTAGTKDNKFVVSTVTLPISYKIS